MRISDWSSDVCSSDLNQGRSARQAPWIALRRAPAAACPDVLIRDEPGNLLAASWAKLDYVRSNTFNGIEKTPGFSCPNSPQKKPRGTSAMLLRGVLALANNQALGSTLFVSSFHPQNRKTVVLGKRVSNR